MSKETGVCLVNTLVHAYQSSTHKAEAEFQVQDQPGLHSYNSGMLPSGSWPPGTAVPWPVLPNLPEMK